MEKVHTVQRLHNIVNIFFQLRNNVALKMGTDSVHARIAIRFASSGSMKVALSRHEFNHVHIAAWLVIHTMRFFKLKEERKKDWKELPALLSLIIWLCLTRTGNYQIHEFDWLKSILKAV